MEKYKYDWLIIFVVHDFEDRSHRSNIERIINYEIKPTGLASNHAFLLIQKEITIPDSFTIETTVKLLQKKEGGGYDFVDIDKGVFDFHSEAGWLKLLTWINKNFPARYICLNTLSHGAAFGILGDQPRKKPDTENFSMPEQDVKFGRIAFFDKGFSPSGNKNVVIDLGEKKSCCKAMQMLWFTELSDAIRHAFHGRKLDIVMMNNCYVQSFETGWILKEQVKYLVAPEAWFTSFGYNYEKFLINLNENPDINPEQVLVNFKDEFISKWGSKGDVELIGISIIDLSYYTELKKYFDIVSSTLIKMSNADIMLIVKARQKRIDNVSNLPPGYGSGSVHVAMIDLLYFYEVLVDLFPTNEVLCSNIYKFTLLFKKALVDQYVGCEYIKSDAVNEKKFRLQGISVFLPFNTKESRDNDITNCAYFGRPEIDSLRGNEIPLFRFTKQSQWDEFVLKYLENDLLFY